MAYRKKYYDFGCTAKICSFRDEEEYQIESLRLVVEGRDRFQVMEKRNQLNGNVLAKVKLISDVNLPEVTNSIETCHRCKAQLIGGTPEGLILHHKFKRHNKVLRRTSMSTAWPAWVHRMYDVNFLKLAIFTELREWNQELKESQCSNEATEFSFWVITMLPIRDQTRLEMLRLESAVQRLRMILNILRKRTAITCSGCSALVANRKDVFSMSKSGTMAAYVNPGGVVHETLTLYKVKGLTYVGRSTTEHSWFPGYAWTICQCAECHQHMGWKFKATKDDLTPKLFWGLTRSSLMPSEPDAHEGGDNDIESHFHRPSL
uniref:Protein cereblon n=1 Tax=Phallusia mammillata TaxID=59560 RepID=A0A6F9DAJ4_9ASCI|nr:protein cereblon [Phallusia mammillata]